MRVNDRGLETPYKLGFYSKPSDECPYGTDKLKQRCAWLGGRSDKVNGHKLDLGVFKL
jgi:ribosome modulation factor